MLKQYKGKKFNGTIFKNYTQKSYSSLKIKNVKNGGLGWLIFENWIFNFK